MEAIIKSTMPRAQDEPKVKELPYVVTQEQFCAAAGIHRGKCRELRDLGYIPSVGENPVRIPFKTGLEGLEAYICDSACGELGKSARFKKVIS
ncbi:MAG TPA: hypothetical protein VN608_05620 [Clostridia bacterium]|nr:hypothetical protein [Clostridia bacterium]